MFYLVKNVIMTFPIFFQKSPTKTILMRFLELTYSFVFKKNLPNSHDFICFRQHLKVSVLDY